MKEVKGIGFTIPSIDEDDYLKIDSFSSLADTDIAVFAPNLADTAYSTNDSLTIGGGTYEGKKLYNKESSVKIKEHSKHWRNELSHFVQSGGTLFVILNKKEDFFIYTGTKDISGTGRNQKTTFHVSPFSSYEYLPFDKIEYHIASGKTIVPQSNLVTDLHNHFKDLFSFDMYIKAANAQKGIFTTKNKDRILGEVFRIKEGNIVFLPNIHFEHSQFIEYNKKSKEEYWTEEAIRKGKIFINCLVSIDKALKGDKQVSPKPNWLDKELYELSTSAHTKNQIKDIKSEIEELNSQLLNLLDVLEEQESLKDLLYETGKPLEHAVTKALQTLGYTAENYDDGELELDQIILSPEGDRLVGECEGKDNKDIVVTKFRQLLDGLNADFERDDVTEKAYGLLFGNPQRIIEPAERTLDFTLKCQSGAKREKIALIKTSDLYDVCKIIIDKKDNEYAKKCREAIKAQLGEIVIFPKYDSN